MGSDIVILKMSLDLLDKIGLANIRVDMINR